ncbi:PAS domain-containing sensor histidine kinase [Sphingosinicella sp. YJ22]|uniref:hybrid sensor histidine kinase/response regulator n=1 Tax=Sphingosinicella sp. YJ22 TaxID=1104780 RepID=UPI001409298E|nr:PAS domain-containing sensor histidine kinase [Sphingosinicella sp. YJ22]
MASVVAERGFAGKARTGPSLALFVAGALVSSAILLWAVRDPLFAAAFLGGTIATGGILALLVGTGGRAETAAVEAEDEALDPNLLRVVLDGAGGGSAALAITSASDLELFAANDRFSRWFGAPASIGELADGVEDPRQLHDAAALARAEGSAVVASMMLAGAPMRVKARLAGATAGHIVWRFDRAEDVDHAAEAKRMVAGAAGGRLGEAGIMAVLADPGGTILAANQVFAVRATGETGEDVTGAQLVTFLSASSSGQFHFTIEGRGATPLRIIRVPVEDSEDGLAMFLMLDELGFSGASGEEGVHVLLEHIPLGLALADMDGRFTFLNRAFRKAAGLGPQEAVAWPGDLVVEEDKGAVSDFVHRYARGRGVTGDLAVRLRSNPEEPVALTVAGARGLGNAAVLMSLKDNSEEARLKREIAQATKMQAVGQLAGGVAHDFNNILTAILGTCDLMLMRHLPGDPDYDDIHQIRSNSNRAANLTRQLLAFSRQQTLRPQVLQLPDAVSEVSHLLNRLLGETVKLHVKHGRNLGAIRADPGQLEQVIVNLAVNARDAMQSKGEGVGTLNIETFAVSSDDVRRMGTDILPIGDYTALRVTDTGTGIPPHLLSKIFEPFFTTKEVGKGTGLGLSTVYGIVKQSGGFIFADSQIGEGTSFTIYLPVHQAAAAEEAPKPKLAKETQNGDWWGSGTILLVEDEAVVRAVAERALTRHGYTVLVAESGEEALEILSREGEVDLMVSDVVMPTMDGPTTVRHARESRPDLPILFISGYAEEQLRKSIDIENVAFLAKPFSVQQLAETVRDTLRAK